MSRRLDVDVLLDRVEAGQPIPKCDRWRPRQRRTRTELVEEYLFMRQVCGMTHHDIAERLLMTEDALDRALRRAGDVKIAEPWERGIAERLDRVIARGRPFSAVDVSAVYPDRVGYMLARAKAEGRVRPHHRADRTQYWIGVA